MRRSKLGKVRQCLRESARIYREIEGLSRTLRKSEAIPHGKRDALDLALDLRELSGRMATIAGRRALRH